MQVEVELDNMNITESYTAIEYVHDIKTSRTSPKHKQQVPCGLLTRTKSLWKDLQTFACLALRLCKKGHFGGELRENNSTGQPALLSNLQLDMSCVASQWQT